MGIYRELGVTPLISAAGDQTRLSGTLMLPEVAEAMIEASRAFVLIGELQVAAGRVIAEATGAEAGYVTAGAAAGIALSAAACIAGQEIGAMERLPETAGIPHDILIQAAHRNPYDRCFAAGGARLVSVGGAEGCSRAELESALGPQTVAVAWIASRERRGLGLADVAEVAHAHAFPVIVDAAGALPPADNLRRFVREGGDLVAHSGGKALRGPQASGFLAGRADLIRSVAMQHQGVFVDPRSGVPSEPDAQPVGVPRHGIGRTMKVGKEEIIGVTVALRLYLMRDHDAEMAEWKARMEMVAGRLQGIRGVVASYSFPLPNGRQLPCVLVAVDPAQNGRTALEVYHLLSRGVPRIFVGAGLLGQGTLVVYPSNLQPGEAEIVADRLVEVLAGGE